MIVKRRAVSNLAVIRSLNFVFLLVFSLAGIGHVLPLDDSPYTGGYNQEIESGRALMQLKHICRFQVGMRNREMIPRY